ncbi:MAG: hypothetical protein P8P65_08135 [Planktotalea sp.]|uniref:hypothetical protein n=1 Tax=Planktotalea sp. TaxID=2029877 RepID=UPI00261032BB|nr:hypothetical protein [Planktotalea sp.]MDG1076603.1 hypothetical protein [Planktotalea sp.]MDG1083533.1 hypothetical protein [Planktotalea sp.]
MVPFPLGYFEDILTRMIAANIREATGVSASTVNTPGGGDGPFLSALDVLAAPAYGTVVGSFVSVVPIVGCSSTLASRWTALCQWVSF